MRDMMNNPNDNEQLSKMLFYLAQEGVKHAVNGLSQMLGVELSITEPEVDLVPVLEVPNLLGGPETEAIGVYLTTEGALAGQFLLIFPFQKALELIDLLMFEAPGTTQEFGSLERSALAEAGNLSGTFFLNKIAEITKLQTLPSTPTVMADMVGAILNIIVATTAEVADQVMLIRTCIIEGDRSVQANFWFIPNPTTLDSFIEQSKKNIE